MVAHPWLYLRDNYDTILAITAEAGVPISQSMILAMQDKGADIGPSGKGGNKYDQRDILSGYLSRHYDSVLDMFSTNHPILNKVQNFSEDFYSIAVGLLLPYLDSSQMVLDIGCGVGRSVYELAGRCRFIYGVEYSFVSAFQARRILRHTPNRLESYMLKLDGDIYSRRILPERRRDNIEIVVASGDNLPFPTDRFDVTNSWNVIDRTPNPEKFLAEQERALKSGGIIFLTDPYAWDISYAPRSQWFGGQNNKRSVIAIRERVEKTSDILQEQEYIPWLFWKYEREFSLFYCHALVARKRAMEMAA